MIKLTIIEKIKVLCILFRQYFEVKREIRRQFMKNLKIFLKLANADSTTEIQKILKDIREDK